MTKVPRSKGDERRTMKTVNVLILLPLALLLLPTAYATTPHLKAERLPEAPEPRRPGLLMAT